MSDEEMNIQLSLDELNAVITATARSRDAAIRKTARLRSEGGYVSDLELRALDGAYSELLAAQQEALEL